MGWKKNRQPKPSISSVTSMSFLTEQNLTFHRFSDGTLSCEGKKNPLHDSEMINDPHQPQSIWTTNASLDYSATNPTLIVNESDTSTAKILPTTIDDSIDNNDSVSKRYSAYSVGNNSTVSSTVNNNNNTQHNGSTMKLIQVQKDDSDSSSKQSRCSIFRGTILCLCMNLTYANIVRFPRELERHGVAFLVPYLLIMFIIGVPILLLEMALGQFLGQGAAHSWKASPFFKGAAIVGRIGSWLGCLWISMQMSLALLYIGQMSFSSVPFKQCESTVQLFETRYEEVPVLGQRCLQKTFLRSISESSLSFGLLAIGLVFIWVIIMMCTHSSRVNRRSILMFGMASFGLLLFQLGWQVSNTLQEGLMPQIWPFHVNVLTRSSTWFYALIQVIMSTQIGIGSIPVVTGKFLYKGDAIRMCSIYMCFNFLITIIATAYYMTTFGQHNNSFSESSVIFPDLTTITSIYDRAFEEDRSSNLRSLIPSLAYLMIFFAGIVSISIGIYTSSRLLRRHPNYIICLVAMFLSISFLLCKNFTVSRLFDMRWTGMIITCALVFDIISITWIYGIKDLSIDLEFSIGRPIMKLWLILWSTVPLMLIAIVACFIAFPTHDRIIEPLTNELIPKWIPIVICLVIILIISIHETAKQVDYNTFSMIHEATRAAKDYGPADPLVRHAWKQWKSVCDDTGQRDFTLKRRGTKDWTSSIKKGQYSHAKRNPTTMMTNCIGSHKYTVNGNVKNHHQQHHLSSASMTGGSNSPNYSGSVFGDSAIEEDISCGEKYSSTERNSGSRRSSSNECNRQLSDASSHQRLYQQHQQQQQQQQQKINNEIEELNKRNSNGSNRNYHKVPIRITTSNESQQQHRMMKRNSYLQAQNDKNNNNNINNNNNNDDDDDEHDQVPVEFTSRVEILPSELSNFTLPPPAQFQAQSTFTPIISTSSTTTKNPLCHLQDVNHHAFYQPNDHHQQQHQNNRHHHLINNIHINGDIYGKRTSTYSKQHQQIPVNRTPSDAAYNNNWQRLQTGNGGIARNNNYDEFSTEL